MSLESAVERLVAAVERNQEGPAVKEIIRQRDAWQAAHDKEKRNREMYEQWYSEKNAECYRLGRVISSLRGVITRMKKGGK